MIVDTVSVPANYSYACAAQGHFEYEISAFLTRLIADVIYRASTDVGIIYVRFISYKALDPPDHLAAQSTSYLDNTSCSI